MTDPFEPDLLAEVDKPEAIDAAVELLQDSGYLVVEPNGLYVSVVDVVGRRAQVKVIAGDIDAVTDMLRRFDVLVIDTRDKETVERLVHAVNSILPVDLLASEKRANTYARIAANAVIKEFTKGGAS